MSFATNVVGLRNRVRNKEQGLMQWRFENFELDNSEHRLTREGAPVHLEKLPLSLLILLLERQPAVVPHAEIAEALWPGVAADAADDRIRTAMKKIRVALGDDHANPTFVEAVQRRGYRFKAPVTEVAPVASPIRHTRLRQAWWVAALATGALWRWEARASRNAAPAAASCAGTRSGEIFTWPEKSSATVRMSTGPRPTAIIAVRHLLRSVVARHSPCRWRRSHPKFSMSRATAGF